MIQTPLRNLPQEGLPRAVVGALVGAFVMFVATSSGVSAYAGAGSQRDPVAFVGGPLAGADGTTVMKHHHHHQHHNDHHHHHHHHPRQ